MGDPLVEPFVSAVPKVNALAERSPGFVWRSGEEPEAARALGWPMFCDDDCLIASFSVWENAEHLHAYVYRTVHGAFLKRGADWFEPDAPRGHVVWSIPAGHIPDIAEARERVEYHAANGSSDDVYTLADLALSASA